MVDVYTQHFPHTRLMIQLQICPFKMDIKTVSQAAVVTHQPNAVFFHTVSHINEIHVVLCACTLLSTPHGCYAEACHFDVLKIKTKKEKLLSQWVYYGVGAERMAWFLDVLAHVQYNMLYYLYSCYCFTGSISKDPPIESESSFHPQAEYVMATHHSLTALSF